MKLLPYATFCLLIGFNCIAQETDATKETFSFPDDFKLTLVKGDGSSQFSQIGVRWPAIEKALVYEVQLVELYAEGVLPETETLTLLGNTIKGLGSKEDAGGFQPNFHLRIEGSLKGNNGVYLVTKEGLAGDSLQIKGSPLNTELLETAKVRITRIDPIKWDYDVKTLPLFSNPEPVIYFSELTSGAPHAARIRATAEGGELATADTGFSQPTLPFFTVREALQTPALFTENLNSRGFKLRWIPPENAASEAIDYYLEQADDDGFSTNLINYPPSRETEKNYEDLEPETSLHFRITAKPSRNYINHLPSETKVISVTTPPLDPLELTGEVSALEPALDSLNAKWLEPTNSGVQRIHYNLEVAADKDFTEINHTYKEIQDTQYQLVDLQPRTPYYFRVTAYPSEGNIYHDVSEPITGSGTTLGNKLETPANLSATAGIGSISAKWEAPINAKGEVVYYLQVQALNGAGTDVPDAIITTETEYGPILELEKDTNFLVSVIAGPSDSNLIDEISAVATANTTTLTDETGGDTDPDEEEPDEELEFDQEQE